MRRKKFLALFISFVMTMVLCQPLLQFAVDAEGSISLHSSGDNTEYRLFTDYYDSYTAGILRHFKAKVYAFAGETLYFGSDIYNSKVSGATYSEADDTTVDIRMTMPDGTTVPFNVIKNGAGHIANITQEQKGPNVGTVTDGYQPLTYSVPVDGIYEFEIYSLDPGASSSFNPTAIEASKDGWNPGNTTVGAWDITLKNVAGNIQQGRVFTNCYMGNAGKGDASADLTLYVVTNDGYIYETRFNGIEPFGFVFFADNRGLITLGGNNHSAYKSVKVAAVEPQLTNLHSYGVTFSNPESLDNEVDASFKIFFEPPDTAMLQGILFPKAYEPQQATNFSFIGPSATGVATGTTYVGQGGWFQFTTQQATSATITVDFPNDQRVVLSNTVADGVNHFYWDGYDMNGDVVPAGSYDSNEVRVSIQTKSGEYHFPLVDVEGNSGGIVCKRINTIYSKGVGGAPDTAITGEDLAFFDSIKYDLYYDNSAIINSQPAVRGYTASNTFASCPSSAIDGINTNLSPALVYSNNGADSGDYTVFDLWTYSPTAQPLEPDDFTIDILDDDGRATLMGLVFYDNDRSKSFNTSSLYEDGQYLEGGDCVVPDVTVKLYKQVEGSYQLSAVTTTDFYGNYFFPIAYDRNSAENYRIVAVSPNADYYYCTTSNDVQNIPIGGGGNIVSTVHAADVGFNFDESFQMTINLSKDWIIDSSFDVGRPEHISFTLQSYYYDFMHNRRDYVRTNVEIMDEANWQDTLTTLPTTYNYHVLLYELVEEEYVVNGVTYYFPPRDGITPQYPYNTIVENLDNTVDSTTWKITNAPLEPGIQIEKTNLTGDERLPGAVFALYLDDPESTPIATETTNADGLILFSQVEDGKTYYVKELSAPTNYILDSTVFGPYTIDASDPLKTAYAIDVTNATNSVSLVIEKQLNSVQPQPLNDNFVHDDGSTDDTQTTVTVNVEYADNESFTGSSTWTGTITIPTSASAPLTYRLAVPDGVIPLNSYVRITETVNGVLHNSGSQHVDFSSAKIKCYALLDSKSDLYAVESDGSRTWLADCSSGEIVFQMSNARTQYLALLYNSRQVADTMFFEKNWVDASGNSATPTSLGYTSTSLPFTLQRRPMTDNEVSFNAQTLNAEAYENDGLVWTDVPLLKTGGANDAFLTSANQWKKSVSDHYWGLRYADDNGVPYVYRIVEDDIAGFAASYRYGTTSAPYSTSNPNITVINAPRAANSYQFSFYKTDATLANNLAGALFRIYTCTNTDVSHVHEEYASVTNPECWHPYGADVESSATGLVDFGFLPSGQYRLAEVRAPDGYSLPKGQWNIDIALDGTITITAVGSPPAVAQEAGIYKIPNYEKADLPVMGGGGVFPILALGCSLIGASAVLYIKSRKRRFPKSD